MVFASSSSSLDLSLGSSCFASLTSEGGANKFSFTRCSFQSRRAHIAQAASDRGNEGSPEKTQLLHVGGSRSHGPPVVCCMDGKLLQPERVIKVLGVLIDEELSWEAQADATSASLAEERPLPPAPAAPEDVRVRCAEAPDAADA